MSKESSPPTRRSVLATSAAASVMAAAANAASGQQSTNLFLLEELEEVSRTRELPESDRNALRAVADWTKTFVVRPHRDLGRAGPVCPFVPVALEHKTLWLAPERSAGRSAPDVIQLIDGYKRLLLAAKPIDGDDANLAGQVVLVNPLHDHHNDASLLVIEPGKHRVCEPVIDLIAQGL